MIRVYLVDRTAESRQQLHASIEKLIETRDPELQYVPRLDLKILAPQELKFHPAPEIVIVGTETVGQEISQLASFKKSLPQTPLLAFLPEGRERLAAIEQILRQGADDVLSLKIDSVTFFQKILVHAQRSQGQRSGKLYLVDSGKGGVGVTSLTAALGEALAAKGKKACLIDLDFDSQDLTRFLQVRPFINENLENILRGQRSVNQDFVMQSVYPVWSDNELLQEVPPVTDNESIYDPLSGVSRIFLSVLEILDSSFDAILVDVGSARASLLQALYHVADGVVFVLNNDPASYYAASAKLTRYRALLAQNARVLLVENAPRKEGLPASFLREELTQALGGDNLFWGPNLGFSKQGARWPGSGNTLFSLSNSAFSSVLEEILVLAELVEPSPKKAAPTRALLELGEKIFLKGAERLHLPARKKEPVTGLPAPVPQVSAAAETKPEPVVALPQKLFGEVEIN